MDDRLQRIGFTRSMSDPCVQSYDGTTASSNTIGPGKITVAVYVDDLLITSNCQETRDAFVQALAKAFKL